MSTSNKINHLTRRDLFKVAGQYGMSSTLMAAGAFGGAMSLANLASAAESTYEKRFAKEPKHTLKFGAAGFMRTSSVTAQTSITSSITLSPSVCCVTHMRSVTV